MDWVRFLDENNIHYVTRGPNTKRGEVSVHCPMCGSEDPSEHLGINLASGFWGCFRDQAHRGKSARTLVKQLLSCSTTQADLIIRQYSHGDPEELAPPLQDHTEPELETRLNTRAILTEFSQFQRIKVRGLTRRFYDYLGSRGFDAPMEVINHYNLRCALTGRYKDRVIIPVVLNGELLGWTARRIASSSHTPRYLASHEDIKTTVLNYDELKKGGRRLFIVEGPFDAIKVDDYCRGTAVRATCTFGTSVTISQIALLRSLIKQYEQTYVMFDAGAEGPAGRLGEWIGAPPIALPPTVKDPGELSHALLSLMCDENFTFSWWTGNQRPLWRWRFSGP